MGLAITLQSISMLILMIMVCQIYKKMKDLEDFVLKVILDLKKAHLKDIQDISDKLRGIKGISNNVEKTTKLFNKLRSNENNN